MSTRTSLAFLLCLLLFACAQPQETITAPVVLVTPNVTEPVIVQEQPLVPANLSLADKLVTMQSQGAPVFEDAVITPGAVLLVRGTLLREDLSLLYIRAITLDASLLIHNETQNYTTLQYMYVRDNEEVCTVTVPKKVIEPVAHYWELNVGDKFNPYLKAFWTTARIQCDDSIPEVSR